MREGEYLEKKADTGNKSSRLYRKGAGRYKKKDCESISLYGDRGEWRSPRTAEKKAVETPSRPIAVTRAGKGTIVVKALIRRLSRGVQASKATKNPIAWRSSKWNKKSQAARGEGARVASSANKKAETGRRIPASRMFRKRNHRAKAIHHHVATISPFEKKKGGRNNPPFVRRKEGRIQA